MTNHNDLMQQLKPLSDAHLFALHDEHPGVKDMAGYSSEARLDNARRLAALRTELIIRNLVPVETY